MISITSKRCRLWVTGFWCAVSFTFSASAVDYDAVAEWERAGFAKVSIQEFSREVHGGFSVPLTIVMNQDLIVKPSHVSWMVDNLNVIYQQCGITFSPIKVVSTDHWQGIELWNKFEMGKPNSLEVLREASPISNKEIVAYFIKGYEDVEKISGFSFAQWTNGVGIRPVLNNSVWIADYAQSYEYLTANNGRYNLLAHELLHVLTLEGQHYGPQYRSLLTISRFRTNRIMQFNCDLAVKHPLVQEVIRDESSTEQP